MAMADSDDIFTVVRANVGIVIRGPALSVQDFLRFLQGYLREHPDLFVVRKVVSGEKIWIHEGPEPGEAGR